MAAEDHIQMLRRLVVGGGYCVGCGICAAVLGPPSRMQMDRYGCYKPHLVGAAPEGRAGSVLDVCPFGTNSAKEDVVAERRFGACGRRHEALGYHPAVFVGGAKEGSFRQEGSSGGVATWVLCELLGRGLVDAVVHVRAQVPSAEDGRLFRYAVSRTPQEVRSGAKSRYYPVELSEVLRAMRNSPGRYAMVGLPCLVKGVRLLSEADEEIAQRVAFCIGLVCGHAKSAMYAGLLGWQCGIKPGELRGIDFRVKLPGRRACDHGIEVVGATENCAARIVRPAADLFGTNWKYGLLKNPACDYCDDVFAETADLTLGDAWLRPYMDDSRGTNLVIARHPRLAALIEEGRGRGRLSLEVLSAEQAALSQRSSLDHRGRGTAYRLFLKEEAGQWHPPKRVAPARLFLDERSRLLFGLRLRITQESHEAFAAAVEAGTFEVFRQRMAPLLAEHERVRREGHSVRRFLSGVHKELKKAVRRFRGRR